MPGIATSKAEVVQVTPFGIWLAYSDKEYFLDYDLFPWFRNAMINKIFHLEVSADEHLYWPELDVDLELTCLENPEQCPLVAK